MLVEEGHEEFRNFNSQPHKEADTGLCKIILFHQNFNSQPHKEADGMLTVRKFDRHGFQLTASQGG